MKSQAYEEFSLDLMNFSEFLAPLSRPIFTKAHCLIWVLSGRSALSLLISNMAGHLVWSHRLCVFTQTSNKIACSPLRPTALLLLLQLLLLSTLYCPAATAAATLDIGEWTPMGRQASCQGSLSSENLKIP